MIDYSQGYIEVGDTVEILDPESLQFDGVDEHRFLTVSEVGPNHYVVDNPYGYDDYIYWFTNGDLGEGFLRKVSVCVSEDDVGFKVGEKYKILNTRAMGLEYSPYKNGDVVRIVEAGLENARGDKGYGFHKNWIGKYLKPVLDFNNTDDFKQDVKDTLSRWRTPNQVSGTHYSDLVVEPNDYAVLNNLDPIQHNVIKYVTRAQSEEDLDKAISQIQRLKEYKFGRKE